MPTTDYAAIAAALPPLTFAPAAEAPVNLACWYLITPGGEGAWAIAHRTKDGWYAEDGLPREPLICAALPETPFTHQSQLEDLVDDVATWIREGRLDVAARAIDELAALVSAIRDNPLRRLTTD